jgi:hypothetical protein
LLVLPDSPLAFQSLSLTFILVNEFATLDFIDVSVVNIRELGKSRARNATK